MANKTNNAAQVNHVTLQQIRNDAKTMSTTAIARKYKIGYRAAKCAVQAKSLSEYRRLLATAYKAEAEKASKKRATTKHNEKQKEQAATQMLEKAGQEMTNKQLTIAVMGQGKHLENLEERIQTVVNLLVGGGKETDSDDLVTRLTRLENKKGFVRRFLERF